MGNHFRTSGDEQSASQAPMPQANGVESKDSVPDFQSDPLAQHAASAGDASAAQSAANPMLNIPSPAAPAQPRVNVPDPSVDPVGPSTPSLAGIPDPSAPAAAPAATAAAVTAPDVFMTSAGSAGPSTDADEARQIRDLDAALQNPDFTSVFAPADLDRAQERKKMARQAGVEPVILTEHLTKIYPAQPNKPALDDVNIEIYPGEFVFLVGHSGSGKTTLLNTLLRNVKPTSGRVLVAGQDLMRIKNRRIPYLRRQIGAVFQDYKLLPNKTAYENVAFALQCIGKPRGVIRAQVPEVLRLVGLADQMDSLPDQLSGGEQQRVSVARAMVNRPPLLICDEPTGNLDPAISLGIMKLLERINRTGTTVIVATHDREMVDSMHRRVIALEGGRVIRDQERGGYGNYGSF
ncbi:cell division ATP-binding protein FtsE [Collinsella tanakaei]|uniref:Cell division ATP-binding protein FtsE n=1 Tax=Collinsella tanakaei TaxID=626935 RepID=A0A3E4QNT7_9ACTN|nr:cell division ATP-binding protein FtsE [Collinsella tanakaei]RGL07321.1 cell division ATP-binding protein FtsE [Collinsella tanakaei]